jgi:hypothetical protein
MVDKGRVAVQTGMVGGGMKPSPPFNDEVNAMSEHKEERREDHDRPPHHPHPEPEPEPRPVKPPRPFGSY